MSDLGKTRCPYCNRPTNDAVLKFYGHCFSCERISRQKDKIKWQIKGVEDKLRRLAFFRKIRGKALKEWMKQQS